jgi:hypothetical protein
MSSVASRITLLTDLLLGAAFAHDPSYKKEQSYVGAVLLDLLSTKQMPPEVEQRIAQFDPACFDLQAAAADFKRQPPTSSRRLMELVAYVMVTDHQQSANGEVYLRTLGDALGLQPKEYADLCREKLYLHDSFTDLARVRLPT